MAEKRHWLVRREPCSFRKDAYSIAKATGPPSKDATGGWRANGGWWIERGMDLVETEAKYGLQLEPGGGPVDVSEWFPPEGRHCYNCRHQFPTPNCPFGEPNDCEKRGDWKHWKPCEQAVDVEVHNGRTATIQGIEKSAPAIPPGEEGGRAMQTFKVVVVEQPCQKEIEAGAEARVVHSQDDIPAKDAQTAVFLAGRQCQEAKPEQMLRGSLLEITAVPFGR